MAARASLCLPPGAAGPAAGLVGLRLGSWRPPWATHTTRGRPPAAPGPAASGGSGGPRSGRQVGAGDGGGAGGEEGLPAAAAAAATAAAPSRDLAGVCGVPGIPRTDPTPYIHTETDVHTNAHGRHMCLFTIYTVTQHPLGCTDMQAQNHIHIHTYTFAVGCTDPETQVHTCIYMYMVYTATRTTPHTQNQTHSRTHTAM